MARYFFDSSVSDDAVEDEDGTELSDLTAVRKYALNALADIGRHEIPKGAASVSIAVRNVHGAIIDAAVITLTEQL